MSETAEIIKAAAEATSMARARGCKIDLTIGGKWSTRPIHLVIEPIGEHWELAHEDGEKTTEMPALPQSKYQARDAETDMLPLPEKAG